MPIKFRLLGGGGGCWGFSEGGGGSANFIFMGAGIFLNIRAEKYRADFFFRSSELQFEPHNPRTSPHKNHVEHRVCNPGGGVYFALLFKLGSDNSYTTPSKK